jgi:uncharacterized protein (DUF2249 family)
MEQVLDVSALEPCEPLEQTLKAVTDLGAGDYLKVLHRREPKLLFPVLEKLGFSWYCHQAGDAAYEVFIWRSVDEDAAEQAKHAIPTDA